MSQDNQKSDREALKARMKTWGLEQQELLSQDEMAGETKFSTHRKLVDLETVINTRTPVWDVGGSGDVRIKLDTDVNGQDWYVLSDDRSRDPLYGQVACWAFPHFNGAHDQYAYEPVAFCFKTFAGLLEAHPTERAIWAYNEAEYAERLIRVEDIPFS